MIPKSERLQKDKKLRIVSYGLECVASPLLLFFSFKNRLLWFRYREYGLAHLKLLFEFSIYTVWKSVRYGVSNGLDMVYWGFHRVGTTLDIFQNLHILYLQYGVLIFSGYGVLSLFPSWSMLKFNSIKDAKKLLEAIEKRFGGNEANRKTQRNLLKQQYKNFTAPSSEMLDQTFDRLQKLVSQLELLGEKLSQEDLDTMSMDDLYNNLKVYEPEVKGMSSSSLSTQNMAFVSSSNNNTSSSNEAVNVAHGVTTASTQVNTAYSTNIDNLSDASSKKSITQKQGKLRGVCLWKQLLQQPLVSCGWLLVDMGQGSGSGGLIMPSWLISSCSDSSQDKYVTEILKKFGFTDVKTASTPMETQKPLLKDEDGEEVDVHLYRSMIGSLMYLTSSRPDIMFVVCACARYQVNPKVSHLHAMKRIFRYLKGQPKLGIWYPKDSLFDLVAYTDSDYAGASLDRKSTTGGYQFLRCRLTSWQCKKQNVVANSITEAEYVAASSCCRQAKTVIGEVQLQALVDGKKIIITKSIMRRDLQLEDAEGVDCLPNATIFEQLTLMGYEKLSQKLTFYKAFFSQQWKFLIHTILQCLSAKTTAWNEFSSIMASAIICLATNQKLNFSKYIFKSMVKNLDNVSGNFLMYPRKPKRKNTEVPQRSGSTEHVADEVVNEEMDDSLVRAATTASSLEVEQDSGNINKTRSKATLNEPNPQGTGSGSGPRRQDTMGDIIAQIRFENVSKTSNDSLLVGVNTPISDEDSMKLKELMEFCIKLQQRVLDLENTKTDQAQEITSLKLRVGRFARVISSDEASLSDQEDASKQGRKINDIDKDAEITLVDETQGRYGDDLMFDTSVLDDEEVFVGQDMAKKEINVTEKEVSTADPVSTAGEVVTTASVEISTAKPTETTITDDLTLAQTLIEIRSAKPKVKGVVIGEQSESTTRTRPQQLSSKDKGKAIMEEPEKPTKRKDQIIHDEEVAQKLQAELKEEDRLVRQREEEANIVAWDNVQAMIDADYQMAQQMQAEEQEKLSIEEKSKLFVQLLEARKKHFAAMRAQEMRNKPPTKAQKRKTMSTYLKNMAGYKHNQLKNKSFDDIQKLFDKAMKRVNTFVDMDTELVEGSEQKVDEDRETVELQRLMKVILNEEEVAVDAIPLATKPSSIVDWKIYKEGQKSYYQITRADESSKMYLVFSQLLKSFDREDLKTLWRLVKTKHGYTRPEEGYKRVLWGDLKVIFKPHVEDAVWRNVQGNKVLIWKLFDSRRVHFVSFLSSSKNSLRINELFGSILVIMKLLIKKLEILKKNIKFRGGLLGLKAFLKLLLLSTASIYVSTASVKLVLLMKIEEDILSSYYCLYTVNTAGV
ncbi:hypothetical protein Tco_1507649 [Tanacetum coccineum]